MTNDNTGENLGKCFKVVDQAYKEIDALISELSALISKLSPFDDGKLSSGKCKKKVWVNWGSERIDSNYIAFWELDGKKGFYLGFQISLLGVGMKIEGNDEPLLHVFKWKTSEDLTECGMTYPLDPEEKPDLWSDSLLVWPGGEDNGNQWTFSLRLAALSKKEYLETYIIKPIEKLLGKPTLTQENYKAEPLTPWDGLVRYNKDGLLFSIQAAG